jgi:uncharacterized membrane protein
MPSFAHDKELGMHSIRKDMSELPRFRDYTSLFFEGFIATFTVLPILVLIYFYSMLPERVPEYLNLRGEVEVWGPKNVASVFRLSLMAIDLQVLCLLTKYGAWQGSLKAVAKEDSLQLAIFRTESLKLTISLFDWFRAFIAIKLGASSLEVVFFSIERLHFLTTTTRVISWAASILGVIGAVFYSYRWLKLNRKLEAAGAQPRVRPQADRSHLHCGIFYYNTADPSWFTDKYLPNFGNKWVYVFLACLFCLPLLMFWPMLNS